MTTPPERTTELLNAINTLLQSLEQTRESSNDRVDALTNYVEALKARIDAQDTVVDSIAGAHEAEVDVIRVLGEGITEFGGRVDALGGKIDGLMNDVALVKGGHTVNAMRTNAAGFHHQTRQSKVGERVDCQNPRSIIPVANLAGAAHSRGYTPQSTPTL